MAQRSRVSVDVDDIKNRIEMFRSDPAWRELSLASKIRALAIQQLEQTEADKRKGLTPAYETETIELLVGFLNCLLDTGDHDGYSLAEISQLIGRKSDKDLIELVEKLRAKSSRVRP